MSELTSTLESPSKQELLLTQDLEELHWTSGSLEEARHACHTLVEERLVACAQIIPWIESTYLWQGQIETAQETKVILKALKANRERIVKCLLQLSTYEVPEIVIVPITGGSAEYLEWVIDCCR